MRRISAWLFGVLLLSPIAASAGIVQITGSGTWDSQRPHDTAQRPERELVVLTPRLGPDQ